MAKRKPKHRHGEAFKVMKYVASDGSIEWIWNSRDGVTPFFIMSMEGLEARHEDWGGDPLAPDHVPKIGDRVFVDLTPERARENAIEFVDKFWSDPKYPMSESFENKEEAVQSYVETWMEDQGTPDIIVVDQAFLDQLTKPNEESADEN